MKPAVDRINLYCFSPGPFLAGRDPVELVKAQIRGGADVIQLREKDLPVKARLELGRRLREVTHRAGVLFIVNDEPDLALILEADGVHLGQDDLPPEDVRPWMPDKIIGVSTHSFAQVEAAAASGADYIGFGPIFATTTKADHEPVVGPQALAELARSCPIPYVAIGGIGLERIPLLVKAGCRRAAVVSDILTAADMEAQCRKIKQALIHQD